MHTDAAVELLASPALSETHRDVLVAHLCRRAREHGTDVMDPLRAAYALREHLTGGTVTRGQVRHLRTHGTPEVAAAAAAHRFTDSRLFRQTLTVTAAGPGGGDVLAVAATHVTSQRRLLWLLGQDCGTAAGEVELLMAAAEAPARLLSAPVLSALLTRVNDHQHAHDDEDLPYSVYRHLAGRSPGRDQALRRAVCAFLLSDAVVHPSVLGAVIGSSGALPPDLARAAAHAVARSAADASRCHADHGPWCQGAPDFVLGLLLTSTDVARRTRQALVEHVHLHAAPASALRVLAGPGGPGPACVTACQDADALASLGSVWWPRPHAHELALVAHPLVGDDQAAALVESVAFTAAEVADLFTRRRATPRFRAQLWVHQSSRLAIPVSTLNPADLAAVVAVAAEDLLVADSPQRRDELGAAIARLDAGQVRALPWTGAWALAPSSTSFTESLTAVLGEVLTEQGLTVTAALSPFEGTVGDLVDLVCATLLE